MLTMPRRSLHRFGRCLALPLAVAVAAACGAASGRPGQPPPTAGPRVVLQQQDAGRTIVVARGTTVELQLQELLSAHPPPATGSLTWDATTSATSVLSLTSVQRQVNPGGRFDVYIADFSARAAGSARLTASGTQTCASAQAACPQPSLTFDVVVH
jgi:hypothetical protein